MLMVSDLLKVARSGEAEGDLRQKSPLRFAARAEAAPVVVWNVCKHCNMTCPHCYVTAGARPSVHDLPTEDALRVIDDLAANGVRVVIFSGGEPLLRDDLFTLLAHARSAGISAQLSTNGVLIDGPVAQRLADIGVGYVGISVDGTPEWNDEYRGLEHAFERAIGGVRHVVASGMKAGVRMTLTKRNVSQLRAVFDAAAGAGATRFYVSHLVYSGRGLKMMGDDLAPAESRAVLLEIFRLADECLTNHPSMRIVTGSNDSDGPLLLEYVTRTWGRPAAEGVYRLLVLRGGNSAGEKLLCIDHRGRVHPDQFWQECSLGTLPTEPFAEILKHPMRRKLAEREAHLEGRCAVCKYVAVCRGSHRERALSATGNMWASDPSCVMTDGEIEHGFR